METCFNCGEPVPEGAEPASYDGQIVPVCSNACSCDLEGHDFIDPRGNGDEECTHCGAYREVTYHYA